MSTDNAIANNTIDIPITNGYYETGDDWFKQWYTPSTTQFSYVSWPNTIYMYQIKCPSCKKMNWAELEKTIICTNGKCGASLRAVSSKPDHIIEIEE